MALTVGIAGMRHHGCAALADGQRVLGVCEQERITRVRGDGFDDSGLPDAALDAVLAHAHRRRSEIASCATAEEVPSAAWPTTLLDHHEAHACAAYLTSPFHRAVILICDHEAPGVSVWQGDGADVRRVEWPWLGPSLSSLYSECAGLVGFRPESGDQRFEALARVMAASPDEHLPALFSTDGHELSEVPGWRRQLLERGGGDGHDVTASARLAAALQLQVAGLVVELLRRIQTRTGDRNVCLGGSLFFHSAINSVVKCSGLFDRVFVPANPGNAGLAVGAAMRLAGLQPAALSPFMGPSYDPDSVKSTLDNCKLRYDWLDEGGIIDTAVEHLREGRLVGWYEGRMEWGPRALGARSILANPFSPYVLENLNRFLKRREPWRGYALSALADAVPAHFTGPAEAPFMECDYRPKDLERFRSVLPYTSSHIRLHAVTQDSPRRFRSVLEAFGQATGNPCLVNTSFNGFHEPIVCTPRDAVRVFFGSGLDVLILDQFVLTK